MHIQRRRRRYFLRREWLKLWIWTHLRWSPCSLFLALLNARMSKENLAGPSTSAPVNLEPGRTRQCLTSKLEYGGLERSPKANCNVYYHIEANGWCDAIGCVLNHWKRTGPMIFTSLLTLSYYSNKTGQKLHWVPWSPGLAVFNCTQRCCSQTLDRHPFSGGPKGLPYITRD